MMTSLMMSPLLADDPRGVDRRLRRGEHSVDGGDDRRLVDVPERGGRRLDRRAKGPQSMIHVFSLTAADLLPGGFQGKCDLSRPPERGSGGRLVGDLLERVGDAGDGLPWCSLRG